VGNVNFQQELRLFTAKLLIVAAIFFIPVAATLVVLNTTMNSIANRLAMTMESSDQGDWMAKTAAKLEAMSPERRETLHRDITSIVTQLRPFIEDLRPLLLTSDNCVAKPNGNP
jgi:hypothetical protein